MSRVSPTLRKFSIEVRIVSPSILYFCYSRQAVLIEYGLRGIKRHFNFSCFDHVCYREIDIVCNEGTSKSSYLFQLSLVSYVIDFSLSFGIISRTMTQLLLELFDSKLLNPESFLPAK